MGSALESIKRAGACGSGLEVCGGVGDGGGGFLRRMGPSGGDIAPLKGHRGYGHQHNGGSIWGVFCSGSALRGPFLGAREAPYIGGKRGGCQMGLFKEGWSRCLRKVVGSWGKKNRTARREIRGTHAKCEAATQFGCRCRKVRAPCTQTARELGTSAHTENCWPGRGKSGVRVVCRRHHHRLGPRFVGGATSGLQGYTGQGDTKTWADKAHALVTLRPIS